MIYPLLILAWLLEEYPLMLVIVLLYAWVVLMEYCKMRV
jgi:hypothetical protein